jgi:GNAT superfamily N-acetyltransferase
VSATGAGRAPGGREPEGAAAAAALVSVRPAEPADQDELALMFERCSPETRYRRFHGPVKAIPRRYLAEALSGSPFHRALVACPEPAGAVVALASCRLVDEGAAELGLLVEDAWQHRGLGTRLLRDLVGYAGAGGLRVLRAQLLAEQAWVAGLLRPYGACRTGPAWDGVLNVSVRLGAETGSRAASRADETPAAPAR